MARTYAQIKVAIWQDDDFRALPREAQHLYFLLLTSPKLNLAGVSDWRPNRIATLARFCTELQVLNAGELLADGGYILIDPRTEEVLVRTLIRHDGILRNPKTAAGMAAAWGSTYSQPIRRCIADEVTKLAAEGIKDSTRTAITSVLDYLSDTQCDTQSDRVSLPPASFILQPATTIPQPPNVPDTPRDVDAESMLARLADAWDLDGAIK